ncbi:MAG: alcohol dehydrogenase catalytic domain-containing protein [Acidobacteriota bacterium]|nr:MAG: alcohol dehydrogenase catalytic domain-containing protein [Acidobacteriota bacterium]
MKALSLQAPGKMVLCEIPPPAPHPGEVLVKVGGVGLCGTDFHIYEGHANYNFDNTGRVIPFEEKPQILGHEFCGTVVDRAADVTDLEIGDRVVVDQGLNCRSRALPVPCEYCATGNSHQCADYAEHGITGLQGALAEYIAVPAINSVRIEGPLPVDQAAMTEPLGCVTHASEMMMRTPARYTFNGERPIRNVLICGAGPAGLLFTQYLRNVIGFDGMIIVSEPNERRRNLVTTFGAAVINPFEVDLVEAVADLTRGEKIHYLIESAGIGQLFKQIPGLLRKQGTILLYGHGHHGVDLGVLNRIQFIEPTFVAPTGASGGFDSDGRPSTYRKSLGMLLSGRIEVSKFITHRYRSLEEIPGAFSADRFEDDYIKGVMVLDA